MADFDHDGRVDLCVSQNGGPVKLYRNTGGIPGVRVRLQGPPGNPTGVGAQVRCSHCPATKEIHAGSGYWSQDAAVLVFPAPTKSVAVTVRWPGGQVTHGQMAPGMKEVVLNFSAPGAK